MMDDIDNVWSAIVVDAEDKKHGQDKLAEAANVAQVNRALFSQAKIIMGLRKHIKHEVIQFILFCLSYFHVLFFGLFLLIFVSS